jgi:purine-binding chemotaxis protein CheW
MEPSPSFGVSLDTAYIQGMAKTADGVKILLAIDRVLTETKIEATNDS